MLNQTRLNIIIILMSLALLGITLLQVQQLRRAMDLRQENFNTSVNDALNQVVMRLEGAALQTTFVRVRRELNFSRGSLAIDPMPIAGEGDMPQRQQRIRIRDSLAIVTEQEATIISDSLLLPEGGLSFDFMVQGDSLPANMDPAELLDQDTAIMEVVGRTLFGLQADNQQLEALADSSQIDSLLREALLNEGIILNPSFMVYGQEDQQARFKAANVLASQLLESPHHVQLFPTLRRQGRYELFVSLEEGNFYALRGLWLQVLGTILFSGIILACFWLSIRVILRQKRVSEMKNDFINNMTHELKTPIATISLATDALRNPQMRGSDEALNRYLGIIKDENARMHRQVERVLQAAQFGRKAIGLNPSDINLHTLIREVVEPVALKVKQRNGQLNLDLRANAPLLHVDRQHIANVLNNLLDNANKYSPDAPHITLKTWSEEGAICVSVQDQGLGISKADQAEIFTRFFRVSTGNLHDVKGFGLGLSYVKEIVEAHGGDIRVQSVLGAGSTFTVQLPTSTPSEQN